MAREGKEEGIVRVEDLREDNRAPVEELRAFGHVIGDKAGGSVCNPLPPSARVAVHAVQLMGAAAHDEQAFRLGGHAGAG